MKKIRKIEVEVTEKDAIRWHVNLSVKLNGKDYIGSAIVSEDGIEEVVVCDDQENEMEISDNEMQILSDKISEAM